MNRIFLPRRLVLVGTLLSVFTVLAQGQSPLTVETSEGKVDIPSPTGTIGNEDAAAIAVLASHATAVGSSRWRGMQAIGKITYGPTDQTAYDATLSNFEGGKFRLDSQTSKGQMSIRLDHHSGKLQTEDGKIASVPLEAAIAGLFPFELARTINPANKNLTIKDQGMTSIGSQKLRRITLERTSLGLNPLTHLKNTTVIDFYFDPTSHLLIKTAASVPTGVRNVSLLSVVTYSDYRQVGTSLIPFHLSETMQGEPYRTLQFSTVQLNPGLDSNYFSF